MRRKPLAALALALLLATAGCSALATGDVPMAQTDDPADAPARTVQVSADGSAETAPDQAVVRIAVVETGDGPATVRDRLARNASAVRSALEALDVAEVRTVRYDVGRDEPRQRDGAPDQPAYRGEHAFAVTASNVSDAGAVIDAAVDAGGATVETVRFTLSDETRRALRQDALVDAMGNARAQAATLGSEADLEITGVRSVSTTERDYRPVAYETAAAAGDGGTAVSSGPVSVSVQVRVTYGASGA